jgi:hypothetical protein
MRFYLEKTHKRAGGVAQVVDHLPSKCEALSSNPSTEFKKKKRERKTDGKVSIIGVSCVVEGLWRGKHSGLT